MIWLNIQKKCLACTQSSNLRKLQAKTLRPCRQKIKRMILNCSKIKIFGYILDGVHRTRNRLLYIDTPGVLLASTKSS